MARKSAVCWVQLLIQLLIHRILYVLRYIVKHDKELEKLLLAILHPFQDAFTTGFLWTTCRDPDSRM